MYGLPQAVRIANDRLFKHLAADGYTQSEHTPGLLRHSTCDITFALVVDDFGVEYAGRENAQHFINVLKKLYEITTNWKGDKFLGLTIQWDYEARTCNISMPGHIKKALQRFAIPPTTRAQHAPHAWSKPVYGQMQQPAHHSPSTTLLPLTLLSAVDSKKSSGPCSTMAGPLIQRFSLCWALLRWPKPKAPRQPPTPANNYSIIAPPILTPLSASTRASCAYISTAMPHTCQNQKHGPAWAAFSTSATNPPRRRHLAPRVRR
jgi:hypothetical protein